MDKPKTNLHFKLMSLTLKMRDWFLSPKKILKEAGVKSGLRVLDFGCGPGSFTIAAAEMVGESGKVYALDFHPLAIDKIKKRASCKGLDNIQTIHSSCTTGLKNASVDIALIYDMLHEAEEPDKILVEVHRVLKPDGVLSFSDHHLKTVSKVSDSGLFELLSKNKRTYSFLKKVK